MGTTESLARLSRLLSCIGTFLEEYESIDEDNSWIGKSSPPEQPVRGPEFAIANVRHISNSIYQAGQIADSLPSNSLIDEIKVILSLAHERIGQADVPAEFSYQNGDIEEAIECAKTGISRAYYSCGNDLFLLAAKLEVEADKHSAKETKLPEVVGAQTNPPHRPPVYDPDKDKKIAEEWEASRATPHKPSMAEFEKMKGLKPGELTKIKDRCRKRQRRKRQNEPE